MTRIITISQRKGGCGKTTSTLNLAHVLGEKGLKVLIIDLDDQCNTTSSIACEKESILTVDDLLLKENISLNDTALKTNYHNVSIVPASNKLSGALKYLADKETSYFILKEKLKTNKDYDYILIDTSPSLSIFNMNAYCASDYVFIPLTSKYFALQGLNQTLEAVKRIKSKVNQALQILGIAFVIYDSRSNLSNEVVEKASIQYPSYIFDTKIGVNIKIEEAQINRMSILSYAPDDRGSEQYRSLGNEILERISKAV